MISEEIRNKYQAVIGLEVHTQLLTKTKAYSGDLNEYGSRPNTNVCPITLGHPGTLPVANEKTIEFAIRLGLATESKIAGHQYYARKNYFYPDLPKVELLRDLSRQVYRKHLHRVCSYRHLPPCECE